MSEKVLKDGRLKIRLDCHCGSAIEAVGLPHERIREVVEHFTINHDGEGHGLCTVKEGQAARRRKQRERMREWRERIRSGDL